jgi:hypothetical protein
MMNGKVIRSASDLAPGDTFTMEDIANDLVAFVHDGSEVGSKPVYII